MIELNQNNMKEKGSVEQVTTLRTQSSYELRNLQSALQVEYSNFKKRGLSLDMSRGKPSPDQVSLSAPMLTVVTDFHQLFEDGLDTSNYGVLEGIPAARAFLGRIMDVPAEHVFVAGNSSLNLMHDCMSFLYTFGAPGGTPWHEEKEVKFLCPVPGYDRHFAVSQHFGFTLVPVDITPNGPNMDQVEELVKDPAVKGIWSVPKYSNPTGITYSEETVRRLAAMDTAAPDFRIFWDNAYAVHHFDWADQDHLANMLGLCKEYGHPERALVFTSTSKITFPGGGISGVGCCPTNFDWIKGHMSLQTISFDKISQLRHVKFLPNEAALEKHMQGQAEYIKPKFDTVLTALKPLKELGIAQWEKPKGGYFIALNVMDGCAKRVVELCKEAGVVLTPAGATHVKGLDPQDRTIRIAPTYPALEELSQAMEVLVLAVQIAALEKLIAAA